ncbi:phosphate ABC transporter permease PstA [Marispirochaeta sp.]|jgi:phosphate transport system permease protein|uniref:phosphate ABC transporter permease PstA n=1 Tax=Marispirochaeta sp. TaxID=2038653 RepID=UPI0029C6FF81|nr:phosphate ABC transporter permease PstA [Marispirochaeta sp.]
MSTKPESHFPAGTKEFDKRSRRNSLFALVFFAATTFSVIVLIVLLFSIINNAFGPVAVENTLDPAELSIDGREYTELEATELIGILEEHLSRGLIRRYNREKPLNERTTGDLVQLVEERIIRPAVQQSWSLAEGLFEREQIRSYFEANPNHTRSFRAWLNPSFIVASQSSTPEDSGIRTALLGSIWIILVTFAFSFPIGIGAAVYLEEYARDSWLNRFIQTNIYNLAGVPSIIYGLLGLAIFVRILEPLSSGAVFGAVDPSTANGRTVFSAGMTLGLLILPIIIINTQEALRALPASLRFSSFGLGATRWQTVRHHLLPGAMERILTGTIIALSRAIGETAPLVVVGASTFVSLDPEGVFSKFTTLPIQIYQWSARPQGEFRNIAAAAILVLLIMLLGMNATAIYFRNRLSRNSRVQ